MGENIQEIMLMIKDMDKVNIFGKIKIIWEIGKMENKMDMGNQNIMIKQLSKVNGQMERRIKI